MPDDIDLTEAREAALIAARVAHAQRQLEAVDARECCDCGAVIPEMRRRAHPAARRCIECQQAMEAGR
jgi:phage/conjugal plasmid C-4 type zinc finger TraR family protein